ncbi:hypothetical protein ABW19_dt0206113 [Dactylella cylindrospora]|nr:hypothetical protein ABW19_dt0206113 [Dactylella cylindrospora]
MTIGRWHASIVAVYLLIVSTVSGFLFLPLTRNRVNHWSLENAGNYDFRRTKYYDNDDECHRMVLKQRTNLLEAAEIWMAPNDLNSEVATTFALYKGPTCARSETPHFVISIDPAKARSLTIVNFMALNLQTKIASWRVVKRKDFKPGKEWLKANPQADLLDTLFVWDDREDKYTEVKGGFIHIDPGVWTKLKDPSSKTTYMREVGERILNPDWKASTPIAPQSAEKVLAGLKKNLPARLTAEERAEVDEFLDKPYLAIESERPLPAVNQGTTINAEDAGNEDQSQIQASGLESGGDLFRGGAVSGGLNRGLVEAISSLSFDKIKGEGIPYLAIEEASDRETEKGELVAKLKLQQTILNEMLTYAQSIYSNYRAAHEQQGNTGLGNSQEAQSGKIEIEEDNAKRITPDKLSNSVIQQLEKDFLDFDPSSFKTKSDDILGGFLTKQQAEGFEVPKLSDFIDFQSKEEDVSGKDNQAIQGGAAAGGGGQEDVSSEDVEDILFAQRGKQRKKDPGNGGG